MPVKETDVTWEGTEGGWIVKLFGKQKPNESHAKMKVSIMHGKEKGRARG